MWICLQIIILCFGLEFAKGGGKTVHEVFKTYNKYIEEIENKNQEQDEMIRKQEIMFTSLQDQLKEFQKRYDEHILRLEKKNEENEKTIIELKKQLEESNSL